MNIYYSLILDKKPRCDCIFLSPYAGRSWYMFSLMWGAQAHLAGPCSANVGGAGIGIPTHPLYWVQWGRYYRELLFLEIGDLSIIISVSLCPQTVTQLSCDLFEDRHNCYVKCSFIHPRADATLWSQPKDRDAIIISYRLTLPICDTKFV